MFSAVISLGLSAGLVLIAPSTTPRHFLTEYAKEPNVLKFIRCSNLREVLGLLYRC